MTILLSASTFSQKNVSLLNDKKTCSKLRITYFLRGTLLIDLFNGGIIHGISEPNRNSTIAASNTYLNLNVDEVHSTVMLYDC